MPTLLKTDLESILKKIDDNLESYPNFVETGTYMGETILRFVNEFNRLFTIELSETLYNNFNLIDYDRTKLKSILGDSSIVLNKVIKEIEGKTIFFLDGHYSSGNTAKGLKDVPLNEEIKHINDLFIYDGLIIIDDLRLFGTSLSEDWSQVNRETLLLILGERVETYLEENDRFIIKIKKINV